MGTVNAEESAARPKTAEILEEGRYGTVCRTTLPVGLRVVTESMPGARSMSVGVFAGVGSRDEPALQAGASHFLEHVLFKGTRRRSAWEISSAIEAVGGDTNAYTTKEYTCYYARVLAADAPLAIDVMCDLVFSSLLAPAEIELERGVICEEIAMHDDEPAEAVHDVFASAAFGAHPLGRAITGSAESVTGLTRDTIFDFYRRHYGADSVVVALAGDLDHERVVELVQRAVADADPALLSQGQPGTAMRHRGGVTESAPVARSASAVRFDKTEQAHLVIGAAAPARHDDRKYALDVASTIIGEGMSSRLFQEIRERRGLAYAVFAFAERFSDAGLFGVYAGCAPRNAGEVSALIQHELREIAEHGVSDTELSRVKGMISGSTLLGLEDTEARMRRLGVGELLYDRYTSIDDDLARCEAVTTEDVQAIAADVFAGPWIVSAVGPLTERQLEVAG